MLSLDPSPYTDKTLHSSELAVKNSYPTSESHVDPFNFTYWDSIPFTAATSLRLKHLTTTLSKWNTEGEPAGQAIHLSLPQLQLGLTKGDVYPHMGWSLALFLYKSICKSQGSLEVSPSKV